MKIETVLSDPAASDWLKQSLRSALQRDPLDAANDAAALSLMLSRRSGDVLSAELHGETVPELDYFGLAADMARGAALTIRSATAPIPRFPNVYCSQCGRDFGPGEHGFSSCDQHPPRFRP